MPQVDSELFDAGQFQAELSLKASPIAAFKKFIRAANATLDARFLAGRSVRRLVEDRAWFIDQMLIAAWSRFSWPDDGIAPGTAWEDVPEDWLCPDCGVGKMDFEMIAIG